MFTPQKMLDTSQVCHSLLLNVFEISYTFKGRHVCSESFHIISKSNWCEFWLLFIGKVDFSVCEREKEKERVLKVSKVEEDE